jgi:ribonuclease-3
MKNCSQALWTVSGKQSKNTGPDPGRFRKTKLADLSLLQKKIGITFKDPSLLETALVHSSFINENPGAAATSNERLEFLGDAVLGLVIAERLYQELPDAPEGELTLLRSALVRREMLAQLAGKIDLGSFLFLGIGEESGGGRNKPVNLAGAFESLIAAIYFDQGLDTARSFILKLFGPQLSKQAHQGAGTNYKSRLQEIMQAERQITPRYHLVKATGPDHAREFTVEVRVGDLVIGRGTGKSKKAAEMEAARNALKEIPHSNTFNP